MNINIKKVPDYEMEALASTILKAVQAFFAQPGVQEEFEIWQKEYHRTGKIFNSKLKGAN